MPVCRDCGLNLDAIGDSGHEKPEECITALRQTLALMAFEGVPGHTAFITLNDAPEPAGAFTFFTTYKGAFNPESPSHQHAQMFEKFLNYACEQLSAPERSSFTKPVEEGGEELPPLSDPEPNADEEGLYRLGPNDTIERIPEADAKIIVAAQGHRKADPSDAEQAQST